MTFKNRWSRFFHKSDSSSSSSSSSGRTDEGVSSRWGDRKPVSHTPKVVHPPASGKSSRVSSLASSRLSRMVSWRSSTATNSSTGSSRSAVSQHSSGVSSRGNRNPNNLGLRSLNLHPSERPLTEENLRQQEVLGRFTMKVAQRRAERTGEASPRSPRDSRSMSTDMAAAISRGRTFETAFREWRIDERGENEEAEAEAEDVPLHQRRITEESINI